MDKLFQQAKDFLQMTLNKSDKIDDVEKLYRYEHSLRVAHIARNIAEQEGQDVLIATLGAILHDVGKFDTDVNADHGRVSAGVAMGFLRTSGLTDAQIKAIHYCIAVHVDGKAGYEYENIPEAETVSDADNIDRFGVYRIFQTMQWDKADTTPALALADKYRERNPKLKHFKETYKLSTPTANRLFQYNLQIQMDFFDKLINELQTSKLTGDDKND